MAKAKSAAPKRPSPFALKKGAKKGKFKMPVAAAGKGK